MVNGKMSGEYLHFLRLYHIPGNATPNPNAVQPGMPHTNDDGGDPNKELLRGKIELVTHDQLSYRLHSEILYPDDKSYIAVMFDKGFEIYGFENGLNADGIQSDLAELKASDYKQIYLVYIAKPPSPHWGYTMVNNQYVYNPSNANTQQLTLPSKTHKEIAQRMLSYIGISLRDQEPMNYAEAKVKEQTASSPSVGRPRMAAPTPQRRR